jgi:[ribosomal protein S5]-alanine N-acetyltransferase
MATIFQTERLTVRHWEPDRDAAEAFAMYGDPEVTRFIGGRTDPSVEAVRDRLAQRNVRDAARGDGTGFWAIVEKSSCAVVGASLLKYLPDADGNPTRDMEVGWHQVPAFNGRGYATEAARGAIAHAYAVLGVPVLCAVINPANEPSLRVARRLGMIPLGRTSRCYGQEVELFRADPPPPPPGRA